MDPVDTSTDSAGPLPPCSLIICSRNRPDLLQDLVASVLAAPELPAEIVVVDQSDRPHPTLGAGPPGEGQRVRYEWSRTPGASRARNLGIRLARHEILAFSDDDMLATPEWLGTLVRALVRGGQRCVVTGRVLASGENPTGFAPSLKDVPHTEVFEGRVDHDVLYTGNMAMYRAATREVGRFDERLGPGTRFPSAEDNDFGFRLLECGYRIVHVPESVLYHRDWRSGHADLVSLRWGYGVGQGAFLAKHLQWRDRYMARRLLRTARQSAGRLTGRLTRNRRKALGEACYLVGLLAGAARWLLTERRTDRVDLP
jgi:GT2 family glycosyltransferase